MAATETIGQKIPQAAVTLRRTYAAPRERVFRAWTDPEQIKRWWGPPGTATPDAVVDLRPGGKYRFTMRSLPDGEPYFLVGTYREVQPPERLVYTWTWRGTSMEVQDSLVTVQFHDREGSTEVVVTHELLPSDAARERHTKGWTGCLDRLQEFLGA
ncbi:MAG TPA: SRPBCC domain-containing protein [Thermoanaerobaculia bacterium]|nr:SRPBCC domain-containing protein [Thermoanaerobaculia bacterium]